VDSFVALREIKINEYCTSLDSVVKQLKDRKLQIATVLTFIAPADNSEELEKLYGAFTETINASDDFSNILSKKKSEAQRALRLQEVADFCATIGYIDEKLRIDTLEETLNKAIEESVKIERRLEAKLQELQEKKRQLNDEEEGARRVNKYLNDYFGHNLVTLEAETVTEGEKRIRFRIMRSGKPAFNLSEGECSLIAFCYFMAKLDDVETSGKKLIVWIDDPISSLDSNHVFFIYSLIRSKICDENNYEQLFVSTHNLDFLKYLKRLAGDPKKLRYFVVQRADATSLLLPMPQYLKEYVTEFNYLFYEIYKCSQITVVDDSNYNTFYNFGNNARKFLEILLFYYYPDNTLFLNKLEKFFGEEKVPALLTDRINNEYSHLVGVFERGQVPVEVPEMLTTAKLIIETLKSKSLDQYESLMKSIGVEDEP